MIQLSLDGKRLYVTTSLFSVWDKQFYPGKKRVLQVGAIYSVMYEDASNSVLFAHARH
jgi:56kDa selenium binding protein (SBP56)